MSQSTAAHTSNWETAEAVLGMGLVLSLILGYIYPLSLSVWLPRAVSISAGIVLLLVGFWVIAITRRQFHLANQPTDPGHPTTQLITTGIFAWSRNPLYLAGGVIFLGLGAVLNSLWMVIALVPTMIALHLILITPEERYLEAKFGDAYRQYTHSVHRWFGRR